jgi:hypothetical protein
MPQIGGYLAMFVREGERPEPGDIIACGQD